MDAGNLVLLALGSMLIALVWSSIKKWRDEKSIGNVISFEEMKENQRIISEEIEYYVQTKRTAGNKEPHAHLMQEFLEAGYREKYSREGELQEKDLGILWGIFKKVEQQNYIPQEWLVAYARQTRERRNDIQSRSKNKPSARDTSA